MTSAGRGLLALVAGLLAVTAAQTAQPLPFRAAVVLAWGEGAGSDAFRGDLGRALTQALAGVCFSGVELVEGDPVAARADLLLEVLLSDAFEEIYFEDSIAGALQPSDPAGEFRRVARFEVRVLASLQTLVGRVPVERKHLVANISRRPLVLGEDPQATARRLAIERIVSDLTKAFCRGPAKLERKIRAALAEPNDDATAPR